MASMGEMTIDVKPLVNFGALERDMREAIERAALGMTLAEALTLYGEWLDAEGLIVDPDESDDTRTHDELARDHLDWRYAE